MKIISLLFIAVCILLTGCSGSDDTTAKNQSDAAIKSKTDAGTKHDALMGYKHSLDTARSITSMAAENEKRKEQMLQDLQ